MRKCPYFLLFHSHFFSIRYVRKRSKSFKNQSSWSKSQDSRLDIQDSMFRVQGSEVRYSRFKVQGQTSRFKVQGSGFRIQGSVFRVQNVWSNGKWLGIKVQGSKVHIGTTQKHLPWPLHKPQDRRQDKGRYFKVIIMGPHLYEVLVHREPQLLHCSVVGWQTHLLADDLTTKVLHTK